MYRNLLLWELWWSKHTINIKEDFMYFYLRIDSFNFLQVGP